MSNRVKLFLLLLTTVVALVLLWLAVRSELLNA